MNMSLAYVLFLLLVVPAESQEAPTIQPTTSQKKHAGEEAILRCVTNPPCNVFKWKRFGQNCETEIKGKNTLELYVDEADTGMYMCKCSEQGDSQWSGLSGVELLEGDPPSSSSPTVRNALIISLAGLFLIIIILIIIVAVKKRGNQQQNQAQSDSRLSELRSSKANIYDDTKPSKPDTSNVTRRKKKDLTTNASVPPNRESSLYQTVTPPSEGNRDSEPVYEDNTAFTNDHDYENFEDLESQDSRKPSQATEQKKSSADYYNL